MITPLYDDVSGQPRTWFQRMIVHICGDVYLSRSLRRQLAARPDTWGVGLWPDVKTESVAKRCAEVLSQNYRAYPNKLIPEDSIELIAKTDPLYFLNDDLILEIEIEFDCKVDWASVWGGAFKDLVDAVVLAQEKME